MGRSMGRIGKKQSTRKQVWPIHRLYVRGGMCDISDERLVCNFKLVILFGARPRFSREQQPGTRPYDLPWPESTQCS